MRPKSITQRISISTLRTIEQPTVEQPNKLNKRAIEMKMKVTLYVSWQMTQIFLFFCVVQLIIVDLYSVSVKGHLSSAKTSITNQCLLLFQVSQVKFFHLLFLSSLTYSKPQKVLSQPSTAKSQRTCVEALLSRIYQRYYNALPNYAKISQQRAKTLECIPNFVWQLLNIKRKSSRIINISSWITNYH